MAEFVKVMQIVGRMCKEVDGCGSCPLQNKNCVFAQSVEALQRIERKVLKWAHDHKPVNVWCPHIEDGEWFGHYDCAKCGKTVPELYDYCPGCGQKMEGEADAD